MLKINLSDAAKFKSVLPENLQVPVSGAKKAMRRYINIEGVPVYKDLNASTADLSVYRDKDNNIAVLKEGCYTLAHNKQTGEIIESSIYVQPGTDIGYRYRAISDADGKVKSLSQADSIGGDKYILTEQNGQLKEQVISAFDTLNTDAALRAYTTT